MCVASIVLTDGTWALTPVRALDQWHFADMQHAASTLQAWSIHRQSPYLLLLHDPFLGNISGRSIRH